MACRMALFNLDDVKALYNASKVGIDDGDKDGKLNQVRSRLDGLFKGAGRKDKGADADDSDRDEDIEDSDGWDDD